MLGRHDQILALLIEGEPGEAFPPALREIRRTIVDAKGLTTIDWFVPSPDGSMVAVSMSAGGSESGTVHVFKASGEKMEDILPFDSQAFVDSMVK